MGVLRLQPRVWKKWGPFCTALNSSSSFKSSLNFHSCNEMFPRLECTRQLVFLSFAYEGSFPTYGRNGSSHQRRPWVDPIWNDNTAKTTTKCFLLLASIWSISSSFMPLDDPISINDSPSSYNINFCRCRAPRRHVHNHECLSIFGDLLKISCYVTDLSLSGF